MFIIRFVHYTKYEKTNDYNYLYLRKKIYRIRGYFKYVYIRIYFMANTSQARKRARQNNTVRAHNTSLRTMLRTALKKIVKAIQAGDKKVA